MAVLSVKNLKKSYKSGFIPTKTEVLKGINFSVSEGKITGFLGGNGAGKTTTMKCFLGLNHADSGEVRFFDNQYLSEEVKKRIGFLPERPYFYEYLTGTEFLQFYGRLSTKYKRKDLNERIERLLKRVDLSHAKDRRLRDYSKGMVQKIGIAQALIHDPEFLILDEPMSGLDPDGRYYLSEIIRETAKEGRAVFFSSHLLPDAEKLCEDLVILKAGEVVFQGSTDSFLRKMGESTLVTYSSSSGRESKIIEKELDLQAFIKKIVNEGSSIYEIKKERNLEDAFVKFGLRGGPK
jgi:ABC-2 type transport system ATP-binding protein